jgi:hypothetical protein
MTAPQKINSTSLKFETIYIESTDRQVDKLVNELYGLTDDEIKVVERV